MDYETLVTMLVASYEGMAHERPDLLRDEDFRPNPQGEWVKPGGWFTKGGHRRYLKLVHQPFGVPPDLVSQASLNDQLAKLEALPTYDMITTHEYRVIRWARERAKEYMQSE